MTDYANSTMCIECGKQPVRPPGRFRCAGCDRIFSERAEQDLGENDQERAWREDLDGRYSGTAAGRRGGPLMSEFETPFDTSAAADRDEALLALNDWLGQRVTVTVRDSDGEGLPFVVAHVSGTLGSSTGLAPGDDGPLLFCVFDSSEATVCEIAEPCIWAATIERWEWHGRTYQRADLHPATGSCVVEIQPLYFDREAQS